MAFYYDYRYGDILFSEHEFFAGNIQIHPESRSTANEWALFNRLVNDMPNMYGDLYDMFKRKGYDMSDPLWKRENMKGVREARDRGDTSDKSIWPEMGCGGWAKDAWGFPRNLRGCDVTRISEPLFGGHPMDPFSYAIQPGDQFYYGDVPMFYPW